MSLFDKLRAGLSAGRDELAKQVGRFKNRKFLEGTIAVCVGVAMSDLMLGLEKCNLLSMLPVAYRIKEFEPVLHGLPIRLLY